MDRADIVIIGSGINALVCGALLAQKGRKVCMLERNDRPGGCIRTEEITAPGFKHDVMALSWPLFVTSPGYGALAEALAAEGVRFVEAPYPTASILADGRSLIMRKDRAQNVAAMNALGPGDGDAYAAALDAVGADAELIFALLGGKLWSFKTARLLAHQALKRGPRAFAAFLGEAMAPARDWLERDFRSPLIHALYAPWVLHLGLNPDSSYSGQMARVVAFALEGAGNPVAQGGSSRVVAALQRIIEKAGGEVRVNAEVTGVDVQEGKARGVTIAGGETVRAGKAVIASVTPQALYTRLLPDSAVPKKIAREAAGYRYGRGDMQIHLALDGPPDWPDPQLGRVHMIHLTDGIDAVGRAVGEAAHGFLPADPTVVVCQPNAADPSRAPDGGATLWVQLQELPRDGQLKGDAAGVLAIPADGRWTEALREAYADRAVAKIERHAPGLAQRIKGRKVYSPADLAALNVNLVGGDPYCGDCSLDQFFIWRPLKSTRNHATPVQGLYHIGAATHPGPGLGGISGFLAAQEVG